MEIFVVMRVDRCAPTILTCGVYETFELAVKSTGISQDSFHKTDFFVF